MTVCWTATAAPEAQNEPPTTPPTAIAIRVEDPPKIDGDVLNDPVWENIPGVSGFWQTTPDEGQPSSEHTEIRILYTRSILYFGVICYDRDPDSIIISDTRRDSPLDESDSFQIILDTYHDRQNGFVFGTNPVGIEYDGQVTDEGQGAANPFGFQTSASGGGFNINWDSSWEVKTEISKIGWTAEFAIPFRPCASLSGIPRLGESIFSAIFAAARNVPSGLLCLASSPCFDCRWRAGSPISKSPLLAA